MLRAGFVSKVLTIVSLLFVFAATGDVSARGVLIQIGRASCRERV